MDSKKQRIDALEYIPENIQEQWDSVLEKDARKCLREEFAKINNSQNTEEAHKQTIEILQKFYKNKLLGFTIDKSNFPKRKGFLKSGRLNEDELINGIVDGNNPISLIKPIIGNENLSKFKDKGITTTHSKEHDLFQETLSNIIFLINVKKSNEQT